MISTLSVLLRRKKSNGAMKLQHGGTDLDKRLEFYPNTAMAELATLSHESSQCRAPASRFRYEESYKIRLVLVQQRLSAVLERSALDDWYVPVVGPWLWAGDSRPPIPRHVDVRRGLR